MFDNSSHFEIKVGNERNFGFTFSIIFFLIGCYFLWKDNILWIAFALIGLIFLLTTLLFSKLLILPNKIWLKIGNFLGGIIAPLIMAIIYIFVFTPYGIILRLFGKDLINKKIDKSVKSYWIKRKEPMNSMKNQY